ncbi:hypothetical protein [Peribacillus alkalitolerans]|uniref:hypothetical protein n=1 Tax=Peribacillus alkalitolerans TaxID=1550385 RepID=UPI0013D869AB|nr:hypothetical protein [Peribacillus alkalitolerans]
MYFFKTISDDVRLAQTVFQKHNKTLKFIFGSIFACIAAVLQSAGGFLPVVGYFLSPLATAPILLCSILSIPIGLMSYFLTIFLLLILQPTELIVFPFTTGLLGVGIGASFYFFTKRLSIILAGTILLMMGIINLLYVFNFQVLGPAVSVSFSLLSIGSISIFSFLYSLLWVEIALKIIKRIKNIIN